MNCHVCGSNAIEETGKFDLAQIGPDECTHDFECFDCEALFTITYTANHTALIARNSDALKD